MVATESDQVRIAAVVLAAGRSQRMGRPKALLPLGDRPVLAHVIENVLASGPIAPVVVVTGHEPEGIRTILSHYAVREVHNPEHERGGMLSSVKAGLAAVTGEADAIFMVLGDQPLVRPATLHLLGSAYRARRPRVVVPIRQGRRGHPILLCGRGAAEIASLPPEATLKTYVSKHAHRTLELAVEDEAILHDLDTPADYAAALEHLARRPAQRNDDERSPSCPIAPAVSVGA